MKECSAIIDPEEQKKCKESIQAKYEALVKDCNDTSPAPTCHEIAEIKHK
jgi:hypothetical protein